MGNKCGSGIYKCSNSVSILQLNSKLLLICCYYKLQIESLTLKNDPQIFANPNIG